MAANPSVPFGFRPVNLYGSSPPNYAINQRQIYYSDSSKIAFNDPVYNNGSQPGYVTVMPIGGTHIFGVAVGPVMYANPTATGGITFSNYWSAPSGLASTTVVQLGVISDPTAVFMAQFIGTARTVADVGLNVDITTSTSGAPNAAGISVCSLGGTPANTATYPFRIVGIVGLTDTQIGTVLGPGPIPNYNPTYDNNFVYVKFNTSELLNTTGV